MAGDTFVCGADTAVNTLFTDFVIGSIIHRPFIHRPASQLRAPVNQPPVLIQPKVVPLVVVEKLLRRGWIDAAD